MFRFTTFLCKLIKKYLQFWCLLWFVKGLSGNTGIYINFFPKCWCHCEWYTLTLIYRLKKITSLSFFNWGKIWLHVVLCNCGYCSSARSGNKVSKVLIQVLNFNGPSNKLWLGSVTPAHNLVHTTTEWPAPACLHLLKIDLFLYNRL